MFEIRVIYSITVEGKIFYKSGNFAIPGATKEEAIAAAAAAAAPYLNIVQGTFVSAE